MERIDEADSHRVTRLRLGGQVVTVHVAAETVTIDLGGQDTRTVRRITAQPVRSIKAHRPRKAAHVS